MITPFEISIPMGMNTIKRLERIDCISHSALNLLDSIESQGTDQEFNDTITKLLESINDYQQAESSVATTQLMHHCDKIFTYHTIFKINIDQNLRNGVIAQMAHTHVVDTWRIILLQICNDVQRIIITYLWDRKRKLGLYIGQLQNTFKQKNKLICEKRALVTILGKLIVSKRSELTSVSPAVSDYTDDSTDDYEIVEPSSHNILSRWFSG